MATNVVVVGVLVVRGIFDSLRLRLCHFSADRNDNILHEATVADF